jgi:hypothetical protein
MYLELYNRYLSDHFQNLLFVLKLEQSTIQKKCKVA